MRRLAGINWIILVVISAAFLFSLRGVPASDSCYFDEADIFPGLELLQLFSTDDRAVILDKAQEFGIQGLLYTNHSNDPFPEKLKQIFHVEEILSPGVTSATLFCLESRV